MDDLTKKEGKFLNKVSFQYKDEEPYSLIKKEIIIGLSDKFTAKRKNVSVLELGCSNGHETALLAARFANLDVVDGSELFLERASKKFRNKNINFIKSLFEDYLPKEKKRYNYIYCNYILEHVIDPIVVLKNMKKLLKDGGYIFVTVPNSRAFSRQLAKNLGIVKNLEALTSNDRTHGHRRVYSVESIKRDLRRAGYRIVIVKGVVFKILADFQLNAMIKKNIISSKHIHGLQEMSERHLDLSDSIFITATKK